MSKLNLNSTEKKLSCSLELEGENAPIDIELYYKIEKEGSNRTLVITSVSCSREWINRIIQDYVTDDKRRIPIPKDAHTILDILKL